MSGDPPDLGKGLFGYRKSAVNQVIADRDAMLRDAEARVRAAEARASELEAELGAFRERNARMDEQLERLRSQLEAAITPADGEPTPSGQGEVPGPSHAPPPPPPPPPVRDDLTSRFLTEELGGILAAAEESAARIVERAKATTQRQITESDRLWRELQAEVARFASWRDQLEPVIRQVQSKVDTVRGLVEDVPERIRHALAPMADAISLIDADMAELASALTPPLLLTPSGFEAEGQSWLSPSRPDPDLDMSAADRPQDPDPSPSKGEEAPGPFGAEAG